MSQAEDVEVERQNWHWRNSMRPVRFFGLDARAAIPVLFLLFHARLWTLLFTIIAICIFHMLEKKGLTFPAAMRALRVWLIGDSRPAWFSLRRRVLRDFG